MHISLWKYLEFHKKQYVLGSFAILLFNILNLLPFYFIRLTVEELSSYLHKIDLFLIGKYVLGIIFSRILVGFLMFIMRRQIVVAARQIEYEIRRDVFCYLQTLDKRFFEKSKTGDLMNKMTADLTSVGMLLGLGFWQIINVLVSILSAFLVMFTLNFYLSLIILMIFPIGIYILYFISAILEKRYIAVQEQNSQIVSKVQDNFSGVRVIKGYALEEKEVFEYNTLNQNLLFKNINLIKIDGPLQTLSGLLIGLMFAFVLLYGGKQIIYQENSFDIGKFVQFIGTLESLSMPMLIAGAIISMYQRGIASWRRIQEIFSETSSVKNQGSEIIKDCVGDIKIQNVSFGILKNINLDIKQGTFIAVTGATGSGKTLLANLLLRLDDPEQGTIFLDGKDIKNIAENSLRRFLTIVPQEPFLFSDTIINNILFANSNAKTVPTFVSMLKTQKIEFDEDEKDINKAIFAAKVAGLHDDIEKMSNGYNTKLGERGVSLSGGQRQRTAIARAIASDAKVIILDDSLSAVDSETENKILRAIKNLKEKPTIILIAHRISSLQYADEIIVLQNGEITDKGNHEELIKTSQYYRNIAGVINE